MKRKFLQAKMTIIGMQDGWIKYNDEDYKKAITFVINHVDRLKWEE